MKAQRTFDIPSTAEKARKALERLQTQQKPGERTGAGSKTDVIQAVKQEIKELLQKGYTTHQIADAFRADVFEILPKTITEIVGRAKRTNHKTEGGGSNKPKGEPGPLAPTLSPPNKGSNKPKDGSKNVIPGSFKIQPDTENL